MGTGSMGKNRAGEGGNSWNSLWNPGLWSPGLPTHTESAAKFSNTENQTHSS